MKKELTPDRCRDIQMGILREIDRFCKENGIRYSLAYGSLIGAVRHKGYIPWDDDIDLMMPRPDYEKFIASFAAEGLRLLDLSKDGTKGETFVKVMKEGTLMVEKLTGREMWGVNVDVFPIDGAPSDGLEEFYNGLDRKRRTLFRIIPYYKQMSSGKAAWFLKYCYKRLRFPYFHSPLFLKNDIFSTIKAFPFESSETAGIYFAAEKTRTFTRREVFEKYITLPFEDGMFSAIADYDTWLKSVYGDYMQFPPEEKRVSHHHYDSYEL
ncbi:MAG: LicD family protein [Bacteroidales bacterium]|nr:LicD family protein [Bacteroidales bacterium]